MKWLLLVLFIPFRLYADAEWKTVERRDLPVRGAKLKASELRITNGDSDANMSFVYFNSVEVVLETVPNLDSQLAGLRDIVESKRAIAGINGGYFDENLTPIGLLISNNRQVHGLQKAKILSGIFYVKRGHPALVRIREFPGVNGVQQAIQCGPFLVDGGRAVPGLDKGRVAARTFVFSSSSALWGFGICRSVTLEEIGQILTEVPLIPGHPISSALNFDGGSSTTFYVKTENGTIFSEGRPIVSNYLIAKPKE